MVLIRFFTVCPSVEHPVNILFMDQQFPHFSANGAVFGVGRFFLCQQFGVLLLQALDRRELFHPQLVKSLFRRLMQQNVHVRCFAYQMTAERFSDTMWTMQQILFMSADRRLAIFLTDELAKTGGSNVRMTHDQMARYMGSAREVVSRLLKYFAQEGWVRLYRGGVEVLDQQKLQEIARGQ